MLRILQAIAQYPSRTGSGIYCLNLLKQWQAQGVEQALLYGQNADMETPELPVPAYPLCFGTADLPFPLPGMSDVMPYPSTVYSSMDEAQVKSWQDAFRAVLQRAIQEFRPDLIVCHHLWLLASLCVETGLPVVGICHGTDLRQAAQHPNWATPYVRHLSGLRGALALTPEQLLTIRKWTGLPEERIFIAGGAFDAALFHPAADGADLTKEAATESPGEAQLSFTSETVPPETVHPEAVFSEKVPDAEDTVRFLYAAKIAASKGIYELLEAFRGLPEGPSLPRFQLTVVGNVPPADAARIKESAGGDPRIRFLPAEPQPQLAERLRHTDVFVLPSYFEGLALSGIEALASGCRLVITNLPGLRGFLGEKIWQNRRLSVVPLPTCFDTDKICAEARAPHIARLRQALLEQGERTVQEGRRDAALTDAMQVFSWNALAARILDFVCTVSREA